MAHRLSDGRVYKTVAPQTCHDADFPRAGDGAGVLGRSPQNRKTAQPFSHLRKRSQYKQDDQEIECILTDESYLTDSYNRKGEDSHLTTD